MVAVHAGFTRKERYGRWPFSTPIPLKDHSDSICRFLTKKPEPAWDFWNRRLRSGQCLAGSGSFFFQKEKLWSYVTTCTSRPPQSPPPSMAKQLQASSKMRKVFKKKRVVVMKRKAIT